MSLFKSKSAPKNAGLYVVVQRIPGHEPWAGSPRPLDEAMTVFAGVVRNAPAGYFAPNTGASLRVLSLQTWTEVYRAALAAARDAEGDETR
jgi:hypothetical protein